MDSPCTRLSVRRLVEFSLRAGDLTPANAAAMYAGMLGHKARQQQSGAEGAENERAVRWTGVRAGIALGSCTAGRISFIPRRIRRWWRN